MIKRYNNQSLLFGVTGLALQIGSVFIDGPKERGGDPGPLGMSLLLVGWAFLIWGLALYAKAKGRSPFWGLMGFLWLLGFIFLGSLADLSEPESQSMSKRELDEVFGPSPRA